MSTQLLIANNLVFVAKIGRIVHGLLLTFRHIYRLSFDTLTVVVRVELRVGLNHLRYFLARKFILTLIDFCLCQKK